MNVYDNLHLKYFNDLSGFSKLNDTTNDWKIIRKWFANSIEKYSIQPYLWQFWIRGEKINFHESNGNEFPITFVEFYEKLKKIACLQFHLCNPDFLKEAKINSNGDVIFEFLPKNRKFAKLITYPYYDDWRITQTGENMFSNYETLKIDSLTFPHRYLESLFNIYEEYSTSPIPSRLKKEYKKNIELFNEITFQLNEKKFDSLIEMIEKTEDESFILQNIEYCLVENWEEKSLWKCYMDYLKKKENIIILTVYSRYCTLFIDDIEMREKYFHEMLFFHKRGKNVMAFWFDIIKIEKQFELEDTLKTSLINTAFTSPNMKEIIKKCNEKIEKYFEYQQKIMKSDGVEFSELWFMNNNFSDFETFKIPSFNVDDAMISETQEINKETGKNLNGCEKCLIKPNFDNFKIQNFAFCSTIIRYLSSKVQANYKLYKTCKYFFILKRNYLCHSLSVKDDGIGEYIKIIGNSLKFSSNFFNSHEASNFFKNFIFTSTLHIDNFTYKNCFSSLLYFNNCKFQIKYLKLTNQNISLSDIAFLNECSNLVTVGLIDVNFFNGEKLVSVETVISSFPTVKSFYLKSESVIFTEKSAENLVNLERKVQFYDFILCEVTNKFDAADFCLFIKKHVAKYGTVKTVFKNLPEYSEYEKNFSSIVKNFLYKGKWHEAYSSTIPNFEIY